MESLSQFTTDGAAITTVQQHILNEQRKHSPEASGSFSWLLCGITLATKMIAARVRRSGLLDVAGAVGSVNVQGEEQQKLDVWSDQALVHCLGVRDNVAIIASEESDEAITFDGRVGKGKYAVVFDPLDGSSNIDVNVSVGTIFSILEVPENFAANSNPKLAILQPGVRQLAAGYVIYGSSTMLVYTTGHGVHGFTLDPGVGAYVLSHEDMRIPSQGKIYSCNTGNWDEFAGEYREYIRELRADGYSLRYIGSLVADFHRTLIKGGVFMYPETTSYPDGKLRLLYEANPIAFLAEQAGGVATNGADRIMELQPRAIHQRTSLVVGGEAEMERFAAICKQETSHLT